MSFVYRSEQTRSNDGELRLIVWRRRLLSDDGDRIELGEVERAVIGEGEQPVFETVGGLLGRPCHVTRERFNQCGYSTKAPKEVHQ